jgi:hypothetical protein
LQVLAQKRGQRPAAPIEPTFAQVGDDKIIASSGWAPAGDRRQERFMVFTFRDNKIIDMQGFTTRRAAERFASAR